MAKKYLFIFLSILGSGLDGFCQDLEYLTVDDFDLNGNVKLCTVITDYGREVFEFDESGLLIKSTTQYNEEDQDITIYRYEGGFLTERRMESYKNGELDKSTSMANFFEIDTSAATIINEKVISYDKQFVENQIFRFDESDRLVGITVSHLNAVDETTVTYTDYKDESTKTYFLNEVIQKSVRTSTQKKDGLQITTVLTKDFLDGKPNRATEETFDEEGRLLTKTSFYFDSKINQFAPEENSTNEYNEDGVLAKTLVKRGNTVFQKEYIFQFDDNPSKNWVKKIVTPDNTYTTRRLEYYPQEDVGFKSD